MSLFTTFLMSEYNNVGKYVENYVEKEVGNHGGNYFFPYPDFRRHVGSYVPNYMVSNVDSDVVSHVVSYVRILNRLNSSSFFRSEPRQGGGFSLGQEKI